MLFVNKKILFLLLFSLYGCTVVPGSHPDIDQSKVVNPLTETEQKALAQQVSIYRITPALVKRMHQDKAQQQELLKQNNKKIAKQTGKYQYRIAPGDILEINLWNQPDLQGNSDKGNPRVRVDANGRIYFPFIGEVPVAGKTISQVRRRLNQGLANYLQNPQLDVGIVSFQGKKAYITGEVKKPGVQAIANLPLTIMDAINQAGGLTEHAVWNDVTLTRQGKKITIPLQKLLQDGDMTYNYRLQSGDVLHIPRDDKHHVILLGEVNKQQIVPLGRYGITLMDALGSVGGLNEYHADASGIFVVRHPIDSKQNEHKIADIYQLNLNDTIALALGNQFELEPGDIIYVTSVPIARWNRVISNLLPSISGLNSINNLAR